MSEYEILFWFVIAVMLFLALGLYLHQVLCKPESQKRIEQTEREAEALSEAARKKLNERKRV